MSMATRVMIIEDDLAIAELHHKYLSQLAGLEVVGIATTRIEAEMQLDILKPDLLLMDVYLPDDYRGKGCRYATTGNERWRR